MTAPQGCGPIQHPTFGNTFCVQAGCDGHHHYLVKAAA